MIKLNRSLSFFLRLTIISMDWSPSFALTNTESTTLQAAEDFFQETGTFSLVFKETRLEVQTRSGEELLCFFYSENTVLPPNLAPIMSVLCWKIPPTPKHTHLDTNDNFSWLTSIKLFFFTHQLLSLQQVSEMTWSWGERGGRWVITRTHTHGLGLNQEGRELLFDLEAQTKVLTCTSSNRVDM